ncbi:MAG: hypothetical protein ACI82A_002139 [Candidatus Azotimanducaceae bacterium]|jgi:hypothetical protein
MIAIRAISDLPADILNLNIAAAGLYLVSEESAH